MEKPRKGSKAGLPPVFEESFKIAVAREYMTGKLSYSQLARKYGLTGEHTPRYFVKWYKQWQKSHQLDVQTDQGVGVGSKCGKELERQLFEANLKITALEMMIRTAEETLGIDIAKKSGTKSSAK
jgi:transposase-like protein